MRIIHISKTLYNEWCLKTINSGVSSTDQNPDGEVSCGDEMQPVDVPISGVHQAQQQQQQPARKRQQMETVTSGKIVEEVNQLRTPVKIYDGSNVNADKIKISF